MDFKCTNCGALLTPPPPGGTVTCHFCGAPQQAAPPQRGGYGGFPGDASGVPRAAPVGVLLAIPIVLVFFGIVGFIVARKPAATSASGVSAPLAGFPIAQLATLSMRQTPEAMAKITGVQPTHVATEDVTMHVPLSGGAWDAMNVSWDPADPTHAKQVYLYASSAPPDDVALRQRLLKVFGRRLVKGTSYSWHETWVSYSGTSAYCEARPSNGSDPFPAWKDAMDAAWDALRSTVLAEGPQVTDAEQRDWLGRGYPLSTIGGIDPTIDVDHAQAAASPKVPGAEWRISGTLEATMAVDHPWYGEIELRWANAKGGTLESAWLRPPPQNDNRFTSQADLEACVKAAYGKPHAVYEGDHLKGDHSTDWYLADGGEMRVYEHMVDITLSSVFMSKKMSRAGWVQVMNVLGQCGRR